MAQLPETAPWPMPGDAQGIFRDPVVRANVEMLKLALTNLALAGIKVEFTADDGWHRGEFQHIGEQLINGQCNNEDGSLEIYASESFEVAPPDYITEDVDPNFQKLGPTVQELAQRGVFGQSITPERAADLTSPTGSRPIPD